MEQMMEQTGENGFHYVDEAAPPALMRALALEILRRKLSVTWWTNIRFEKSFQRFVLIAKASGCIAVSGGLEVASDRLLKLIDKVTVEQVARVTTTLQKQGHGALLPDVWVSNSNGSGNGRQSGDGASIVCRSIAVWLLASICHDGAQSCWNTSREIWR
jgi:hypothetical protein